MMCTLKDKYGLHVYTILKFLRLCNITAIISYPMIAIPYQLSFGKPTKSTGIVSILLPSKRKDL